MKKLIALFLAVLMLLSMAACVQSTDPTTEAGSTPPETFGPDDPYAGLNKEIYVNKDWKILQAKHEKEVTITMWIPNSATSTMGVAIQALADKFNAEQKVKYPGKNITVVIEYQNKSGTLNEKLQAAILANNNPVISAIGVSSVPLYEARALDLRQVFSYEELQAQSQGMMQYSLYNGKYMLNPYFPSASNIIVYNKTLMESKGVTMPDVAALLGRPGATRAELLADTASLTLEQVPESELREFVLASSERYHRVLMAAYRRHDPNHLAMGAAHCPVQSSDWIEGAARHVDFIGINTYDVRGVWSNALDDIYRRCDKPFAVLEYSFVVEGRGYRRYSHGNTVVDENARGLAYRYFVEREAARPHCLGTGHFLMWDQPVTRRSLPDGENFTFGLLTQCDQPYERMLAHVMETNRRVFDIHDGKTPVCSDISPMQLLATPGAAELFAPFVPGRIGMEVTVDDINGPTFHDVPSRIKCTGAAPREGVAEIGVVALTAERRVVTARAFLWDAKLTARMEDHLLVEASGDGESFTPHAARFEPTWQQGAVREWRVVADGFAPEIRFVRLSFRTAKSLPLWAWQLSHVTVE